MTPFEAVCVALAEVLDVPFVTADARLAWAPGLPCQVELLSRNKIDGRIRACCRSRA